MNTPDSVNSDDSSRLPNGANPMPPSAFEQLKAGQTVIVDSGRYGCDCYSLETVFRVTDTQIVLRTLRDGLAPLDSRYDRNSGYRKGADSWNRDRLRIATPELLERVEKGKLVSRFSNLRWKDLRLAQLRAVDSAIKTTP